MKKHDLYLDSETLDSLDDSDIASLPNEQRIEALRFGLAVTSDDMFGWRTWTSSLVDMLWLHLSAPTMRAVGWDILTYDLPVIRHAVQHGTRQRDERDEIVDALDLSAEIVAATTRHYRLDTIARSNLKRGKIMGTQMVIEWLRAGDPASMIKATDHCRNNVQLVMDLYDLIQHNQPLLLPGRLEPTESGWLKTNEATLRLWFTPDGRWLRVEDLRGQVQTERPNPL